MNASGNEGAAIGIAWGDAGASSSISAAAATGTWDPMVPATLAVGTTASDVTFSGASIRTEAGVAKFNATSSKNPFKYTSTDQTPVEYFRVTNLSHANAATVTLTLKDVSGETPVDITDTNSLLRVGVFTSTTPDGTYLLRAVMGVSANLNTEWGVVTTDGTVDDLTANNAEVKTVTSYEFNLAADGGTLYFRVIAWLDGVALNDDTAESEANFGLNFTAVQQGA